MLVQLCIPSLTFGKKPILNFVTKECLESTVFKRKFNILMLKPENQPMADIQSNFLDAQASLAPIIPVSPSVRVRGLVTGPGMVKVAQTFSTCSLPPGMRIF